MRLFFYGTLLDADVQTLVLGRQLGESELRPALLRHFRRVYVAGRAYPMLLPHRGGTVGGTVADRLSQGELARVHRYEGDAFRLERQSVVPTGIEGQASAVPLSVWLFRGAPATRPSTREWRLAAWQTRDKMRYLRELRGSGTSAGPPGQVPRGE